VSLLLTNENPNTDKLPALATHRRAMGIRRGEQLTQFRPISWQKWTDFGSPPCSPQMPVFTSRRVEQPPSTPIFINLPTPVWSAA
jgi:hypothetical protein